MTAKSKTIIRQKRKQNYTIIPNDMLNNEALSFKAKGILTYLLSKPDNWNVYMGQLAKASKDGYEAVCSGVTELMEKGYVFRRPIGGDNPGGWEYFVYDEPQSENPFGLAENPTPENTDSVKPATTNTRLEKVRTNIRNNPLPPKGELASSGVPSHANDEFNLFPHDQKTADADASEACASKNDPPKAEKVGFAKSGDSPPQRTRRQAKPVDDAFIAQITEINPHFKPEVEMPKIKTWLLKHPNRKLTRGLVANWSSNILQRKQETMEKDETPRLPNGEIDWAKVKPRD